MLVDTIEMASLSAQDENGIMFDLNRRLIISLNFSTCTKKIENRAP